MSNETTIVFLSRILTFKNCWLSRRHCSGFFFPVKATPREMGWGGAFSSRDDESGTAGRPPRDERPLSPAPRRGGLTLTSYSLSFLEVCRTDVMKFVSISNKTETKQYNTVS